MTNVAARSLIPWRLRARTLELGRRTLIMGVINVTPDSFSDGGRFFEPQAAIAHALALFDEGAHSSTWARRALGPARARAVWLTRKQPRRSTPTTRTRRWGPRR